MMRDDYSSVFRNIRTERTTGRYPRIQEPQYEKWWVSILGGAVMGLVLAIMVYWGLT